jgi:hypothetical protein
VTKDITKPERGKMKMSNEENGATTELDKLLDKGVAQLRTELKAAYDEIDRKVEEISILKRENLKLHARAEAEVKSALMDEIGKISSYSIDFLAECSIDRLEQILEDSKMIKTPLFSSSGSLGRGTSTQDKLHTMFKFGKKRE